MGNKSILQWQSSKALDWDACHVLLESMRNREFYFIQCNQDCLPLQAVPNVTESSGYLLKVLHPETTSYKVSRHKGILDICCKDEGRKATVKSSQD